MIGVPSWQGRLITPEVRDRTLAMVEAETGVSPKELLSESRTKRIAHARQFAMWTLRQITRDGHPKYSLTEIGFVFKRSHWTVMHAIERVDARLATHQEAA